MNANNIEANSYAPDASRPLHGVAPFRLISGRGIVDARGRLVATVRGESFVDAKGYVIRDRHNGFKPIEADDNAHAVCAALNLSAKMRAGLRYILELANAEAAHALRSDTFKAERIAELAREALTAGGAMGLREPLARADRFLSLASESSGDPAEWYVSELREDGTADGDVIAWCDTEEDADRIAAAMNAARGDA